MKKWLGGVYVLISDFKGIEMLKNSNSSNILT